MISSTTFSIKPKIKVVSRGEIAWMGTTWRQMDLFAGNVMGIYLILQKEMQNMQTIRRKISMQNLKNSEKNLQKSTKKNKSVFTFKKLLVL